MPATSSKMLREPFALGYTTRTASRLGTPLTMILHEAEDLRVDLILVGSRETRPHQVRPGKRVPRGAAPSPCRVLVFE